MAIIFSVCSNGTTHNFESKRDATNFARKISKDSYSRVYKDNGSYNSMGRFHAVESTLVAYYKDGKRQ